MHLELVSIETDGVPLDGLYYEPAQGPASGAALLMHANTSNFYTGAMKFLPPVLSALGFACLAFNRRGHDVLGTRDSRETVGGAYQTIAQSVADNDYAARWLKDKNFDTPVVIGHSNGGMLGVQHCADHRECSALILLSAHRGGEGLFPTASAAGLLACDKLGEFEDTAQRMVADGRGSELMLLPGWWYVLSAESFLDLRWNTPDIIKLAPKVSCPVLFIRGDSEPKDMYPAEDFRDRTAGACDIGIVDDCGHFYVGREREVQDLVVSWLTRTFGLGPRD